jgi:hypothetical protein
MGLVANAMIRFAGAAFTAVAISSFGWAQDPQGDLDRLIQQQRRELDAQHQTRMLRFKREQAELKVRMRYQTLNVFQLTSELLRYCSNGEPPCEVEPPEPLVQELARRGLIEFKAPNRPNLGCVTFGDGLGGGITDCN